MRPPDRRKAASVSLDLESSATFWKKLMIEEASPEMWYSEPKIAGHRRALEGFGGGDFSAGGRHGRVEDGCQALERDEQKRCTATGTEAATDART